MISPPMMNLNTGGNRVGRWSRVKMSALGHKRTCASQYLMSARSLKADMNFPNRKFCRSVLRPLQHWFRHMAAAGRAHRQCLQRLFLLRFSASHGAPCCHGAVKPQTSFERSIAILLMSATNWNYDLSLADGLSALPARNRHLRCKRWFPLRAN